MAMTTLYGKPISSLTDAVLDIAEKDCAAQIEKLTAAGQASEAGKDLRNYPGMLAKVQEVAEAVQAEKRRRVTYPMKLGANA